MLGLSVKYVEDGEVTLFVWHLLSMSQLSHVPTDRHDEGGYFVYHITGYRTRTCPNSRVYLRIVNDFIISPHPLPPHVIFSLLLL